MVEVLLRMKVVTVYSPVLHNSHLERNLTGCIHTIVTASNITKTSLELTFFALLHPIECCRPGQPTIIAVFEVAPVTDLPMLDCYCFIMVGSLFCGSIISPIRCDLSLCRLIHTVTNGLTITLLRSLQFSYCSLLYHYFVVALVYMYVSWWYLPTLLMFFTDNPSQFSVIHFCMSLNITNISIHGPFIMQPLLLHNIGASWIYVFFRSYT